MKVLVTAIVNGDTFEAVCEGQPMRVRIAGYDAAAGSAVAFFARETLEAKILGRWVRLVLRGKDDYGRMVADVYVLNQEVVVCETP